MCRVGHETLHTHSPPENSLLQKIGHGHPDEDLAETGDKWAKNRNVPVKSGLVATLA